MSRRIQQQGLAVRLVPLLAALAVLCPWGETSLWAANGALFTSETDQVHYCTDPNHPFQDPPPPQRVFMSGAPKTGTTWLEVLGQQLLQETCQNSTFYRGKCQQYTKWVAQDDYVFPPQATIQYLAFSKEAGETAHPDSLLMFAQHCKHGWVQQAEDLSMDCGSHPKTLVRFDRYKSHLCQMFYKHLGFLHFCVDKGFPVASQSCLSLSQWRVPDPSQLKTFMPLVGCYWDSYQENHYDPKFEETLKQMPGNYEEYRKGLDQAPAKFIHVFRDPRDTGVSWAFHKKNGRREFSIATHFEHHYRDVAAWIAWRHYWFTEHVAQKYDVMELFYEDMKLNPAKEFARIINFFGMCADEDVINEAIRRTDVKELAKKVAAAGGESRRVRKGGIGTWQDDLPDHLLRMVNQVTQELVPEKLLNFWNARLEQAKQ